MHSSFRYAGAGVLAAVTGLGAAHLAAALLDPASSPVLAVGSTVIDLTPTPVKEWAVARFGTRDKPILVGSVLAGTLVLAGTAGLLARRRLWLGLGLLSALIAVAGYAAASRPTATATDLVPALVAGLVGAGALTALTRRAPAVPPSGGRRGLLVAGVFAALAVGTGGLGQWLINRRSGPVDVTLPLPADRAATFPSGSDLPGISPLRTPVSDFYRVDTALVVPVVDVDDWTLTIDGDVRERVELGFADLLAMPLIERDITLTCVSNEVGGPYVGSTRWLGVRLTDLLDLAGVGDRADQILSTAADGFTVSTPLAVATDGRDAMVALGMDGRALPRDHGFPARLLTPGLYGYVGATKWLTRLTLTTYAEAAAYWTQRGWATTAPVKVQSRIDTPRPLSTIAAGRHAIAGVAWAQHRGIGRVEVRVDGGPWQAAQLGADVTVDYWRQWWLPWEATSGQHRVAVRATTLDGETQTAVRRSPFPDGASGVQEIVVTVA